MYDDITSLDDLFSDVIAESSDRENEFKATEATKKRGIVVIDDSEFRERIEQRIPQITRQATEWSLSVWQEWAEEQNCLLERKRLNFDGYEKIPTDIGRVSDGELNYG